MTYPSTSSYATAWWRRSRPCKLHAGDPLPSTRGLAADLAINFHTVNKAYDLLRQEGLVRLTRKSGAVVVRYLGSGPPPPAFLAGWYPRAQTLLAEAIAQGVAPDDLLAHCRTLIEEGVQS